MLVDFELHYHFLEALEDLRKKYGEKFAELNGFGREQLNLTSFIDKFAEDNVVADVSIDGNANVGTRDICSLRSEMNKPHEKLLAFNKIFYELEKKHGLQMAKKWLEEEWNGCFYMHDANTSSLLPYCYKGEEMLTVKLENIIYNLSFKDLYNLIDKDNERYDASIKQNAKFPNNLYVLDYDLETERQVWTKINRIVEHPNTKAMHFVKYANGLSQIVTEDHPIITAEGDKPAIEVTLEDEVLTFKPEYFAYLKDPSNIVDRIYYDENGSFVYRSRCDEKGYFLLTQELGWLLGMALSEGTAQESSTIIHQTEPAQRERLLNILNKYNIPYTLQKENGRAIALKVHPISKWLNQIIVGKTSAYKALPNDYIYYPEKFLDGVVAGMIDGDGTLDGYKNRHCQIRITSRVLLNQLSNYLGSKGIYCGDRIPHIYSSKNSFKQKLPLFGIGFTLTNEKYFSSINSIKIAERYIPLTRKGDFKNKKYEYQYDWVHVTENVESILEEPVVYDITTETGHFICNNVLSHNCYAYDLEKLATEGLFFIDSFNHQPPKHLTTFTDFVGEFVSYTSNRCSGELMRPLIAFPLISGVSLSWLTRKVF